MNTSEEREAWCRAIEQVRVDVVDAALTTMYANPFWEARYGARGRQFARQDNDHHLNYLMTAIRLENPGVMADYLRWLRGVLVPRGMCTRHVHETLTALAQTLQQTLPEVWPNLADLFQAAYTGLTYTHPACYALSTQLDAITAAATVRLVQPRPDPDSTLAARRARCQQDNGYHLSYLQDALEVDTPALFGQYVGWVTGFLAQHNVAPDSVFEALAVLADEIGQALPDEASQPLVELLTAQLPLSV